MNKAVITILCWWIGSFLGAYLGLYTYDTAFDSSYFFPIGYMYWFVMNRQREE